MIWQQFRTIDSRYFEPSKDRKKEISTNIYNQISRVEKKEAEHEYIIVLLLLNPNMRHRQKRIRKF